MREVSTSLQAAWGSRFRRHLALLFMFPGSISHTRSLWVFIHHSFISGVTGKSEYTFSVRFSALRRVKPETVYLKNITSQLQEKEDGGEESLKLIGIIGAQLLYKYCVRTYSLLTEIPSQAGFFWSSSISFLLPLTHLPSPSHFRFPPFAHLLGDFRPRQALPLPLGKILQGSTTSPLPHCSFSR